MSYRSSFIQDASVLLAFKVPQLFHSRNMISLRKVYMASVSDMVNSPAFTKLSLMTKTGQRDSSTKKILKKGLCNQWCPVAPSHSRPHPSPTEVNEGFIAGIVWEQTPPIHLCQLASKVPSAVLDPSQEHNSVNSDQKDYKTNRRKWYMLRLQLLSFTSSTYSISSLCSSLSL